MHHRDGELHYRLPQFWINVRGNSQQLFCSLFTSLLTHLETQDMLNLSFSFDSSNWVEEVEIEKFLGVDLNYFRGGWVLNPWLGGG